MFWVSLIFMIFPILPVVTGWLSAWHLLIDILFVVAYLGVLTTKNQRLSWLYWGLMLVYVAGNTAFVAVNYIWFFFFLSNLLIYHFGVRSLKSLHVWTFLLTQVLVVGQLLIIQRIEVEFLFYLLVILAFVDLMTFGMVRIRIVEDLKEAQAKQNAQINLLLELKEIHQISKDSMNEVRTIVENLKSRTLASELETVKKMLEIAGIEVQVDNHLDKASLTQDVESTAAMILLELATNIIKHASAKKAYLKLERTDQELVLTVRDDGKGFATVKGNELHTVRDRAADFSGQVELVSLKDPTEVRVHLPYKERK